MKFLLTLLIFCLCTINAQAKQLPELEWTQETQLYAARMLYGEATFHFPDIQLLYVIKNRWKQRNKTLRKKCFRFKQDQYCNAHVTFLEVLRGYSKAVMPGHDRYLKRTKQEDQYKRWIMIQQLPWGDYDGWPSTYNKKWATWRMLITRWYKGYIKERCPGATHWGGRKIDTVHQGFIVLKCANDAGGLLPKKKPMVNALQKRGHTKFKGKVSASRVKQEFQSVSYDN